MVLIRCKHCGLQEWNVSDLDGTSYLRCSHCGKTTTVIISTRGGSMKTDVY